MDYEPSDNTPESSGPDDFPVPLEPIGPSETLGPTPIPKTPGPRTYRREPRTRVSGELVTDRLDALTRFRMISIIFGMVMLVALVCITMFVTADLKSAQNALSLLTEQIQNTDHRLTATQARMDTTLQGVTSTVARVRILSVRADRASRKAMEVATTAADTVEGIDMSAAEEALKAARTAKEVVGATADRVYRLESILSEYEPADDGSGPSPLPVEATGLLDVIVKGKNTNLRFRIGPIMDDVVVIEEDNYVGIINVPKGYTAIVRGSSENGTFTVDRKLRGRVIDELKGRNNVFMEQ